MTLTVLHTPDCPHLGLLLDNLRTVTDRPIETREVTSEVEAAAVGMAGSPTLLVDGRDPFGTPDGRRGVLACRLYRDEYGRRTPVPTVAQVRTAVAAGSDHGEVLSAWRSRAQPLDAALRTAHKAILRSFAETGRPSAGVDPAALRRLHDLDAIRLAPDGRIAVVYPFSATPTRHRVTIGGRTEVHAMCAIDALGIAAMTGEDTRIESTDPTNGEPIAVTMTRSGSSWDPAAAVVFVGAEAGGGPSADCCCDYLNFFTDGASAESWRSANPDIPGQILTRREAEALAVGLFGHLLD